MKKIKATDVRRDFADAVNQVAYGNERFIIERRGADVAAIVSIGDLKLIMERLEEKEDKLAGKAMARALAETGEDLIPYHKARKKFAL